MLPDAAVCHLLDIDEVPGAATLPQISSDLVEDDQVPGKKNHMCVVIFSATGREMH